MNYSTRILAAIGTAIKKLAPNLAPSNMNPAQRIQLSLGAREPEAFMKRLYRGPTPERTSKGRKAGAYGRGLRNWISQKQAASKANQ